MDKETLNNLFDNDVNAIVQEVNLLCACVCVFYFYASFILLTILIFLHYYPIYMQMKFWL